LYYTLITSGLPEDTARSILFASFGTYTLFIAFTFRDLSRPIWQYSLTENKLLLVGVMGGLGLMIITFSVPFLRSMFDVVTLEPIWIGFVALWSIINIVVIELSKWFANRFLLHS